MNSETPYNPISDGQGELVDSNTDGLEPFFQKIESVKKNEEILTQLVQMNFSMRAAMLCVQITASNDLEAILQFITTDESGFYNHPFLDSGSSEECIICSDAVSKHVDSVSPEVYEAKRREFIPSRSSNITSLEQMNSKRTSNRDSGRHSGNHTAVDINVLEEKENKPIIDPVTCTICYEDVERADIISFGGSDTRYMWVSASLIT